MDPIRVSSLHTPTLFGEEAVVSDKLEKDQQVIENLNSHLRKLWEDAYMDKDNSVALQIVRDMAMRKGEYNDWDRARIGHGSTTYVKLVNEKCRSAEAWIKNLINDAGDDIFSLKPTKEPELPMELQAQAVQQVISEEQELMQMIGEQPSEQAMMTRLGEINEELEEKLKVEAERRAKEMTEKVCDQLHEGRFIEALLDGLYDFCCTKAMIIAGPERRKRKQLEWKKGQVKVGQGYIDEFRHVPVMDFYPAPETGRLDRARYVFERVYLSLEEVESLRGADGVKEKVLNDVLHAYGEKGYRQDKTPDWERRDVTHDTTHLDTRLDGMVEGWIFYGTVKGSLLKDWGVDVKLKHYPFKICATVLAERVVRVVAWDGRIPYFKASYDEESPEAFWGEGIAGLLSDIQERANLLGRAINNNIALCGGPQIIIEDSDRIIGETVSGVEPFKIWQLKRPDATSVGRSTQRRVIDFYQPDLIAPQLHQLLEETQMRAENVVGIPSYPLANFSGAAKGTASGMSMVLNAASKGMLAAISNIDNGIIKPIVELMNRKNLIESKDDVVKGDLKCVAKGLRARLDTEQTLVRGQELLANTLNPIDNHILGIKGRAMLLKRQAERLGIEISDLIPEDDMGLMMQFQKNMMMLQGGMAGSPGPQSAATNPDGSTQGGDDYQVTKGVGAGARNVSRAEGR